MMIRNGVTLGHLVYHFGLAINVHVMIILSLIIPIASFCIEMVLTAQANIYWLWHAGQRVLRVVIEARIDHIK